MVTHNQECLTVVMDHIGTYPGCKNLNTELMVTTICKMYGEVKDEHNVLMILTNFDTEAFLAAYSEVSKLPKELSVPITSRSVSTS